VPRKGASWLTTEGGAPEAAEGLQIPLICFINRRHHTCDDAGQFGRIMGGRSSRGEVKRMLAEGTAAWFGMGWYLSRTISSEVEGYLRRTKDQKSGVNQKNEGRRRGCAPGLMSRRQEPAESGRLYQQPQGPQDNTLGQVCFLNTSPNDLRWRNC
jgi:hypothetical protein